MDTEDIIKGLQHRLAKAGFKSAVVSIRRLSDLNSALTAFLEKGLINQAFYDEVVSRYHLKWDFEVPDALPDAESIIITAAPQPKINVRFNFSDKTYNAVIPPTYSHDTDDESTKIIADYIGRYGYKIHDALLPEKLLAACSGLAKYGRNNVAYIDGMGSYHRTKVYFTNIPHASDDWQEWEALELCSECKACMNNCPTKAIREDRFLISGEKCLTFWNEGRDDFPEWINPDWHNALIGCMACQDVCPVNRDFKDWIEEGGDFSEEETRVILEGVAKDRLPPQTYEKLKRLWMLHDYELLQRNLRVLIRKQESG
jgi:epoxyqueuosine reductase